MYEAFYGFKEKPFSMLPDPGFLFLSKKHQAALTLLEYGLLNHVGFCVISGEAGAGKTTILRALLERTGGNVTVGLITNTHQSFGGLLDWVLSSFDLHRPNLTHVEMHQIFMEFLISEYAQRRTVLLIVDEAQNMSADALEELRMLSNVNSEKDQLMQVVLAGQPALKETLRKPELMQFAQRIAVDYHLEPLSLKETCGYIQHRLLTAGAQRDVFTPAACERIYTYSGGTPRLINLLCETALVYGFADQLELIDVDLVDEMVQERMKNSVVPIVNRDIAKQDNDKASSKELERDFPWICPEGGTRGLKPSGEVASEVISPIVADHIKPEVKSLDDASVEQHAFSNRGKRDQPVVAKAAAKAATKTEAKPSVASSESKSATAPSTSRTFVEAEKNILSAKESTQSKAETRKQFIKYGLIALVFAFILIAFAMALNDETESKPSVENDEVLELQKQQEQEAARLKQLQSEAEALKKERDAALVRMEEEKRAKQEAEKIAAEKTALAIKVAEDRRKQDEQKKIAEAKARERQAKEAEARARAEAERVKQEAAALEEEKRLMKARLEKEIRLKEEQEARRMALELQEQQRLALEQEKIRLQLQEDVAKADDKAKKNLIECSGPTARFKSGCR